MIALYQNLRQVMPLYGFAKTCFRCEAVPFEKYIMAIDNPLGNNEIIELWGVCQACAEIIPREYSSLFLHHFVLSIDELEILLVMQT